MLDERKKRMIRGAVAEIDLAQIAITRKLTPAQRVAQAASMIEAAESVATYRLRAQHPELTEAEALRKVRMRSLKFREMVDERWRHQG